MRAGPRIPARRRAALALGVASFTAAGCDVLVGLEPPTLAIADASVDGASSPTHAADADRAGEGSMEAAKDVSDAGEPSDGSLNAGPCDASTCDGVCADLASDSANCGACGHSCLGGACENGRCLPTVLATGSPVALAADGTNVYWTEAVYGTVRSCPATGCPDGGTVLFVGPGGSYPQVGGIALQSGHLFFLEGSGGSVQVFACPVTGCSLTSPAIASGFGGFVAGGIAIDSNNVYWGWQGGVYECPLGGCLGGASSIVSAQGSPGPSPFPVVAAGGGRLYFDNPMYGIGGCDPSIPCPGGCPPSTGCNCGSDLCGDGVGVSGSNAAQGIAVGASAVYWTSGNLDGLFARPLGDADASALFARAGGPGAVVVDAYDVYFGSTDDGGTLYRCAVKGCAQTPTPVAAGLGTISSLAVDATRIYAVVGPGPGAGAGPAPPPLPGLLVGDAIIAMAR